jgi:hypothetical protein
MALKLEDLKPTDATFTVKHEGFKDHVFTIKKLTLRDEVWLQDTFKNDLQQIFRDINFREISRIIYHQLDEESKKLFKKQSVVYQNEDGDEITEQRGGYQLFFDIISGMEEKIKIFEALIEAIGLSRPLQAKVAADAQKKSEDLTQSQTTGDISATSSVVSTVGP